MGRNQHSRGWVAKLVAYSCAATAAGALMGAILGALGALIPTAARIGVATALGVIAIVLGALEVTGRRIAPPQCDRETPQRWMHAGPIRWALRNGAALGFGASTRIGFTIWYVTPLAALLFADVALGALIYGAYAGARSGSAWILIRVGSTKDSFEEIADWLHARAPAARSLAAAQLLAMGLAAVLAVGL